MNPKNSAQALAQLQKAQKSAQDPSAIMAAQNQQLGVQGAEDTVKGLRGAINNTTKLLQQVAPSVMGRTGNSLVTAAQANRQVQNEQAPISETLSNQGRDYGVASEDYNRLSDRAREAANLQYAGQQDKLNYMKGLYEMLYGKEEAARSFKEQQRQFNASLNEQRASRAAASSGGFRLGGGTESAPTKTGDPVMQDAYNDVKSRKGQSEDALRSDFFATASSAKYGNQRDLYKLQIYRKLFPKMFKGVYRWE